MGYFGHAVVGYFGHAGEVIEAESNDPSYIAAKSNGIARVPY